MILFDNHKFSILEKDITLKEYPYQLKDNLIVLSLPNNGKTELKYELINNQIKIWWSNTDFSIYDKSKYDNSQDDYLADIDETIDLPVIENLRLFTRPELCIDIAMVNEKIFVNKKQCDYSELEEMILNEKSKINQLNANLISIRLYVDKNISMKNLHELNQILRNNDLLKIIHMGKVNDNKISKLQRNYIGMGKLLPPLDAKDVEIEDLAKDSIEYFKMDATNPENTPELIKPKFKELISNSKKYVAGLWYDSSTIFNTYIGYQDMARTVIYEFRNNYAWENYNLIYDDLSPVQKKEIRKIYPLIISEAEAYSEINQ
jgi:hypothetical protein